MRRHPARSMGDAGVPAMAFDRFERGQTRYVLLMQRPEGGDNHFWIEENGVTIRASRVEADIWASWQRLKEDLE